MSMTAKAQKLGLASRRHQKKPSTAESVRIGNAQNLQTQVTGTVDAEAQIRAERLAMHRKAVSMIAGMWKDHEGGPVDGVEYQNKMREAW